MTTSKKQNTVLHEVSLPAGEGPDVAGGGRGGRRQVRGPTRGPPRASEAEQLRGLGQDPGQLLLGPLLLTVQGVEHVQAGGQPGHQPLTTHLFVSDSPYRSTERYNGRTTNVALVMAQPDGTATKIQNSGRAGYMITRTPARDR